MTTTLADLNRKFGIPGVAQVVAGNGGLPLVQVSSPTAAGEMYLHGGHVTSWTPTGKQEVFFVSANSLWADGHAIRGGVPICFPWFGDKADDPHAPAHGFVRTKSWQLESIEQTGGAVAVTMSTASDESTKKWWPADFQLLHRATFGAELALELVMTNTGSTALHFEEAMHAYHRVGDVAHARVSGLDGTAYLDKTDSFRKKTQHGEVVIESETDRVYLDTPHPLRLNDPVLHRQIQVTKQNSQTTVVWNPWVQGARKLADLAGDQWKHMLCIETSNVGDFAVELMPGQQHSMTAVVRVAGL
ncbi:MAG: D-hexose-6-phosphate mutarotase [Candidatus Korobacteraceae bacterium]